MLHWCDCGLYKRRLSPSRCIVGLLTSSSPRLARPSHTFRTTEVPSRSTHSFEPVSGRSRRLMCVFQLPNSKSKSCCPSPALSFCAWIFAVPEFVCAHIHVEYAMTIRPSKSHARRNSFISLFFTSSSGTSSWLGFAFAFWFLILVCFFLRTYAF